MGNLTISAIPDSELEKFEGPTPFAEFPKWLYHTDGRSALVNSEAEESFYGKDGDWHPNPTLALETKAKRDEADAQAAAKAKK